MSNNVVSRSTSPVPSEYGGDNTLTGLTYDSAQTGSRFAREFETVADKGKAVESSKDQGITRRAPESGQPKRPSASGANQRAIKRFGDNEAARELYREDNSSTEKEEKVTPFKGGQTEVTGVSGVYTKSRFVPAARKGKKLLDSDAGLFPFNYVAGRRSENVLSVGRDDRMSPAEAKDKLLGILSMFGVESESHEYLYTFTHALLVTHALNGASIAGPGRASFFVNDDEFQFGDVVKFLGPDSRRFYRAYADETAKALLSVLERYDPGDIAALRVCGQIRAIAVNKKLTQFPYLIHDSADACYRTNVAEMAAVAKSKQFVLNNGGAGNTLDNLEAMVDA